MNVTNRGYYTTQYLDQHKRTSPKTQYTRNQSDYNDSIIESIDDKRGQIDDDLADLYSYLQQKPSTIHLQPDKTANLHSKTPYRPQSSPLPRLQHQHSTGNLTTHIYSSPTSPTSPTSTSHSYHSAHLDYPKTNTTCLQPLTREVSPELPQLDSQPPTVLTTKIKNHGGDDHPPKKDIRDKITISNPNIIVRTSDPDDLTEEIITPAQLIQIQRGNHPSNSSDHHLAHVVPVPVSAAQAPFPNRQLGSSSIESKQLGNRGGERGTPKELGYDGYYIKQKEAYDAAMDFDFRPKHYTHKTFHDVFNNKSESIDIYNPMEFVFDNKPHGNNFTRAFQEMKVKLGKDDYNNYDYYKSKSHQTKEVFVNNVSDDEGDGDLIDGDTNNLVKKKKPFTQLLKSRVKKFKQTIGNDYIENFDKQLDLHESLEKGIDLNNSAAKSNNPKFEKSSITPDLESLGSLPHSDFAEEYSDFESEELEVFSTKQYITSDTGHSNSSKLENNKSKLDNKVKKSSFFTIVESTRKSQIQDKVPALSNTPRGSSKSLTFSDLSNNSKSNKSSYKSEYNNSNFSNESLSKRTERSGKTERSFRSETTSKSERSLTSNRSDNTDRTDTTEAYSKFDTTSKRTGRTERTDKSDDSANSKDSSSYSHDNLTSQEGSQQTLSIKNLDSNRSLNSSNNSQDKMSSKKSLAPSIVKVDKAAAAPAPKKSSTWNKMLGLVAVPDSAPPPKAKAAKKKSSGGGSWKATVSKWNSPAAVIFKDDSKPKAKAKAPSVKSSKSKKSKEVVVEADRGSLVSKVLYYDPDTKQLDPNPPTSKSSMKIDQAVTPAAGGGYLGVITNHPWMKSVQPYITKADPYVKMVTPYASKAAPYAHPTSLAEKLRNYDLFKILFGPLDGVARRIPFLGPLIHVIEVIFFLWVLMEGFKIIGFILNLFHALTSPFVAVQKSVS